MRRAPQAGRVGLSARARQVLRSPGHATAVWGIMERSETRPDYACYRCARACA